jgi:murein DD-endopeptidase MepM/ murein hydrolase activator NlpD
VWPKTEYFRERFVCLISRCIKKRLTLNLLRLGVLLGIVYFLPVVLSPLNSAVFALSAKISKLSQNSQGIGGMAYTERELAEMIEVNALTDVEARFALSTGLSESDIVIPEPKEFSAPQTLLYSSYKIQRGDIIGFIAENFGLSQGTLISVNAIKNTRQIYPDEVLRIPNQDGILHTVSKNETLGLIAGKYEVEPAAIMTANELFSENIHPGSPLFIPGAKLDSTKLQEINGDLFIWPIFGRISSRYGYRISPINGVRAFHTGIDISAPLGLPIKAAMAGRVISAAYSEVFGNYVVISHHSNYRTLYGHMNAFKTKSGAYVKTGETIGYVGSTGQSTGSHLHFTVYKNGKTVNPLFLMN